MTEKKVDPNDVLDNTMILDCAVLSDDYFIVLAEKDVTEEEHSSDIIGDACFVTYDVRLRRWGYTDTDPLYKPNVCHLPKPDEYLVVDDNNEVFYGGLGENKQFEKRLGDELSVSTSNIRNIDGEIYSVGGGAIIKRRGVDNWVNLLRSKKLGLATVFFEDIDGFSKDDIYAVGHYSEVWHFDGQDWYPIDICGHKINGSAVCCAEDGYVYIVGSWGYMARGRGYKWETYRPHDHGNKSIAVSGLKDVVSYKGRVFTCDEDKTYIISDELKPIEFDFDGQITPFGAKSLYAAYGWLIVAGFYDIAIFDGKNWTKLYGSQIQEDIKNEIFANYLLEQSEDLINALHDIKDDIPAILDSIPKK